jgi:hypothetical protein
MRNLLLAAAGLTLLTSACGTDPQPLPDPPMLKVTSPARSLIQGQAGKITVTGTVAPNATGTALKTVMVNNVAAMLNPDGAFTAVIDVKPGATLIHTEATDAAGGKATDTRSVEAGQLRAQGSNIENAVTTAISANAFAKIAGAAGPILKSFDLMPMLAPLQPMVHVGDANGEDCLFARAYVDNVKMTDAKISLVPVAGGLSFSLEIDGLDVPGHMRYAVACLSGQNTTDIKASKVVVSGTLMVSPDGMNGFATQLADPNVVLEGLDISASGVPGTILGMLPLDSVITYLAPKAAEMFMGPMMNKALGALGGPKQLMVLGKTIDVAVTPSDISFDPTGGVVVLNMKMLIEGTETSKGYIFTDNGMPAMNPGQGLQIGLADDMANEMLSQLVATGMLNLSMPASGGTFDSNKIGMTSPPMISANSPDGKMRLILPDMTATFMLQGTPVGMAAINASVDLKIAPANNGYGVALQLGAPDINVDVLDDIPNETRFTNQDLSTAVKLCLDSQITSISALLGSIPLPAMAGLQMKNMSMGADDGYVMVSGTLE